MSDRAAVVLAVLVFAAALAAVDGHLPALGLHAGALVLALAVVAARQDERVAVALVCIGAALLAVALGQRSVEGLTAPLETGPHRGEITLVSDPAPDGRGAVAVDVRLGGRRLRAAARTSAAAALDDRLAGERVTVIATVGPPTAYDRFVRHRHIAGRLTIETVVGWRPGDAVSTAANGLRRTLAAGAESLPARQQSLLAGLTLGDDRAQPADLTDAFQAAGLTHLLAVSGQNIAFVLVVARPALSRLGFRARLGATLAVLAGFALVTRFEPSVLRASAMAAVAAVGVAVGRPASSLRALTLGVAAMVLIDPLLTTSLGFRLSIAGSAGIVLGSGPIERLLPGPRGLAAPLSVTLAAQAAVSPLLVATFGGVPLASVPANLLAAPAAGPVMVWGLTGGLAAGVLGGPVAAALHLPSRLLLWWLDTVATRSARWPLGDLRATHVVVLALAALLVAACRRRDGAEIAGFVPGRHDARPLHRTGRVRLDAGAAGVGRERRRALVRWVAGGMAVAAVVAPMVAASAPVGDRAGTSLGPGAALWSAQGGTAVVVDGRVRPEPMLAALRAERVGRVDVVVVRTPAQAAIDAATVLRRRWPASVVLVPEVALGRAGDASRLRGARSPAIGDVARVGGLSLTATTVVDRLEVEITVRAARAPPMQRSRRPAGRVSSPSVPPRSRQPTSPRDGGSRVADPVAPAGRIRVAGVVPVPRFGREGEVVAAARAVADSGADLVDVSLEPRLVGAAASAIVTPVVVRASSVDGALAVVRARARSVLFPVERWHEVRDSSAAADELLGAEVAIVVDDLGLVADAIDLAHAAGVVVAFDSTRLRPVDALAAEAVAVTDGCRILRTHDVRRSRRVGEVLGAVLSARRDGPIVGADR